MSYSQRGSYAPSAQWPPPQQSPSPSQSDQSSQTPPSARNGSFAAQYLQQRPQYPGQPTYAHYQQEGGAVQHSHGGQQEGYPSPQANSYGSFGRENSQYNPQNYAQPGSQHPPLQQYNPQAYANVNQPAHPPHYQPSRFPDTAIRNPPGPVDPLAYGTGAYPSPGNYSSPSYTPPQPAPQYGQSPQQQYQYSPQQSYAPQPPSHQYHYAVQQTAPVPQPPAAASHPQDVPYATDSYRPRSTSTTYSQRHFAPNPLQRSQTDAFNINSSYQAVDRHQSPSQPYASSLPSGSTNVHARTATLDRHPQQRPLPAEPPYETDEDDDSSTYDDTRGTGYLGRQHSLGITTDMLFEQVESAVMNSGQQSAGADQRSPSISVSHAPAQIPLDRTSSLPSVQNDGLHGNGGRVNGRLSPHAVPRGNYPDVHYSSDSDAEAAHGLAMMQMAEEDDAIRRNATAYGYQQSSVPRSGNVSDGEEFAGVDMSSFGGGYDVRMSYGRDPNLFAQGGDLNGDVYGQPPSSQNSSVRRSHPSGSSRSDYEYHPGTMHFSTLNTAARVDEVGTGGLSEPTGLGRRQSFDEGDEEALFEGYGRERYPDEPPDIMFQQASTSYRPLPAVPYPESDISRSTSSSQALPPTSDPYQVPYTPDAYTVNAQGQYVPRSSSLVAYSNTPQVAQPLRSKTDAEEKRLRALGPRSSIYSSVDTASSPSIIVDLPAIGKRFTASKLGASDFDKCEEPWSLMALQKWLLQVTTFEQNTELKEADVKEALTALFTNKVPTMNIIHAEILSNRAVATMLDAGTLVRTEEWVNIVPGYINGVFYQLTQSGCYAPTVHEHFIPNLRCYSRYCQRTLRKVNLQAVSTRTAESWAEYYNLTKEDLEGRDPKEMERQNVLHEIVSTEEGYMLSLDVLQTLYRDALVKMETPVLSPKKKEQFIAVVFGRVDMVRQANEEHLLPQLKYRQQEQGPWIGGFSDIFRQWIRKAKTAYVDYATDFPKADYYVRQEMDNNIEFRNFVERVRNDKRSNRLPLDSFLKSPISRLQRYTLLLNTVLKNMKKESDEKTELRLALLEVRAVAMECDARVADMQRKIDLSDLNKKLKLRQGMENAVELNLDHFGRELVHRGDLQRMGTSRFNWLDCHALLFDHYLVLAKPIAHRVEQGDKLERYDVSRLPIPMDLLILDSATDPPVQKSTYVKGITSVTNVSVRSSTPADQSITGRTATTASPTPAQLQQVNTNSTVSSTQTLTAAGDGKDDRILYPFRVKHLGRDTYTLFAPTDQARKDWCTKITEAKTKHAAALHAQNAEPFRLRVIADSAFVFDGFGGSGKGVVIKGTPVDRAIQEVEHRFKDNGRPGPICRAKVNCAASFATPAGKQMVAVGTDYGVYISEMDNPRGWTKAITISRVTQLAVLEEFNLFLFIADKALIAYHLDVVCPNERTDRIEPSSLNDSARKAPQKLSGNKDVGFFVTGRMKGRTLVFYKKRENVNSIFKVLEPVFQKSSEKKRGIFKRGTTEFFREYDEFYIPAESTGMNLFHSSLAVSTARGFEVLTLERKQTYSVPELNAEHVQNIASHIKDEHALGMFRLTDQEFLLCYTKCAVYVNKHGDVSRSVIMDFVGTAQNAALYGPYLVLFDSDFVEIRNAQNGRLKQIIAGREIKCLDDGANWSANMHASDTANGANGMPATPTHRTLKFVMQHPDLEKTQIVLELVRNRDHKD